jgi:hypothetical protein
MLIPLVKGTMQYEHMLLHPLIIVRFAVFFDGSVDSGVMSAYVSSALSCTFAAPLPPSPSSSTLPKRLGKLLYASGPQTTSTILSSFSPVLSSTLPSSRLNFRRSAMHPSRPTLPPRDRRGASSLRRLHIFDSAFSRIAQVMRRTMSASEALDDGVYPASTRMRLRMSESAPCPSNV